MVQSQALSFKNLDKFSKLNVLWLVGQTVHEARKGNQQRALLYAATAVVAFKYKKVSFLLQGALAADRRIGWLTGVRPLETAFSRSRY